MVGAQSSEIANLEVLGLGFRMTGFVDFSEQGYLYRPHRDHWPTPTMMLRFCWLCNDDKRFTMTTVAQMAAYMCASAGPKNKRKKKKKNATIRSEAKPNGASSFVPISS